MAASGYTPIILFNSTTTGNAPTASNLAVGELAINVTDGKLFFNQSGTIKVLANATYATSVSTISFGTTGLTPSTATNGVVTVAGTLATTNGGTGLTSFTANGVVYASSTSALATGSALVFDGTNLGLGVTPSAWSGYRVFQIGSSTAIYSDGSSNELGLVQNAYYSTGWKYGVTGAPASWNYQYQGQYFWKTAPSGTAGNAITFTQAMTLDVSGKLLVGTTSQLINESTLSLLSSGNTMTVKTTGGAGTVPILCWNNAASGTINLINFFYGSSLTAGGTITTNGTVTTLNSPSDYRLKNITGALTTSGAFIDALKPLVGTYKSNGSAFVGFIADQLQEVSPSSVQGEKDTVDENGNPVYQSLAYASPEIITNLIAEIQSVRKRLAALENK